LLLHFVDKVVVIVGSEIVVFVVIEKVVDGVVVIDHEETIVVVVVGDRGLDWIWELKLGLGLKWKINVSDYEWVLYIWFSGFLSDE